MRLIWIAMLAIGCTGEKGVDADGDGYDASVDCDDNEPAIRPNAAESCDGKDNNCDGAVDEDGGFDEPIWYPDADGDEAGDGDNGIQTCAQPAGYVDVAGDCDDTDAKLRPGAREICDEVDNDCDGGVDVGAVDATTWFEDDDEDTFGNPDVTKDSCTQPKGFVENSDDCDDTDETVLDAQVYYTDSDDDGFGDPDTATAPTCNVSTTKVTDNTDCSDDDAAVNPLATEVCDGIDNNCDGAVDENGVSTWFMDADQDGYGDSTMTQEDCGQPEGYVAIYGDCDDTDATTNPGATELCDGKDNTCEGTVDENVLLTWYIDMDGDGHGTAGSTLEACTLPMGYAAAGDDCNDAEALAWDVNAAETCDNVDNNCDGAVDEGVLPTWYADWDADSYGDSGTSIDDCNQPNGYVAVDGDCDDGKDTIHPGATEACDDIDNNCSGDVDELIYAANTDYTLSGSTAAADAAALCATGNAVAGSLTIDASTFTNLSALSCICGIDGDLTIQHNVSLSSTTGLKIASVGGSILIDSNGAISDLSGFSRLTSIGLDLILSDNPAITGTSGFEGITSIAGDLTLSNNVALSDLSGLENITTIGDTLTITGNTSLGDTAALTYATGRTVAHVSISGN